MTSSLLKSGVSRRGFLRLGMLGGVGLGLSDVLCFQARAADEDEETPEGKAKNVVMIWLGGGPATIDMWDLKPDAPDNIKGPFQPIDSSAEGIQISDKLPQMAQVMDRATIVRSLAHSIPAHGPGTVYMNTGNKPSPAMRYPSLGSLTSRLLDAPAEVPPYVNFGNDRNGGANAGYLGAAWNPFRVQNGQVRGVTLPEDVTVDDLSDRVRLFDTFDNRLSVLNDVAEVASGIDQFQQKALDILRSDKTRNAFNLNEEPDATRQRYGNDGFGRNALAARRLVEAGVRFVTLGTGGWDTHGNNFNSLQNRLLPPIDRSVSALIEDLDDKGLLDSTIVYVTGEFGRTPRINGNSGRDHWARSMAVVLAGGGFPKGMAYGTTNDQGMEPDENPCSPEDVSATIMAARKAGRCRHEPDAPCNSSGKGRRSMRCLDESVTCAVSSSKTQRLKDSKTQRLKDSKTQRLKDSKTQRLKDAKTQRRKDAKTQRRKDAKTQRRAVFPGAMCCRRIRGSPPCGSFRPWSCFWPFWFPAAGATTPHRTVPDRMIPGPRTLAEGSPRSSAVAMMPRKALRKKALPRPAAFGKRETPLRIRSA